jgi:hypothetical protein
MRALPSDSLANGAEGIKDMITSFEDAYVETTAYITERFLFCSAAASRTLRMSICRRNYMMRTLRKDEQ